MKDYDPEVTLKWHITRFQQIAKLLLKSEPSREMIENWYSDDSEELQDFCACNCPVEWTTGIGIIEAIELIIQEAVDNSNMSRDYSKEFPHHEDM